MKKLTSLMLTSLFLSSCASNKDVTPVTDIVMVDEAPSPAELLFSFKRSNMSLAEDDLFDEAKKQIQLLAEPAHIKLKWIEDNKLPADIAFKIMPTVEQEVPTLVIKYADDIFQDHSATLNLTRFLTALLDVNNQVSVFDLYNNATVSDPSTLVNIAKMRRAVLTPLDKPTCYVMNTSQYNGFVAGESSLWEKKVNEYVKLEKKAKSEKRKPAQTKVNP